MKKNANGSVLTDYANQTHRIGKISTLIAILLILMVPAVISFAYRGQYTFNLQKTLGAIVTLTAIYGVVSIVEVVSFCPFLGSGGTYLSFITGNILAMKLPCATNALRVNGIDKDSEEGEVITTLAIGASSIVTTAILFLGMFFLGRLLVPVITSDALAPAFDNVTPALTGALAAPYFLKHRRLAIPGVIIGAGLYLYFGYGTMSNGYSVYMFAFLVGMFLFYLLMQKVGLLKKN